MEIYIRNNATVEPSTPVVPNTDWVCSKCKLWASRPPLLPRRTCRHVWDKWNKGATGNQPEEGKLYFVFNSRDVNLLVKKRPMSLWWYAWFTSLHSVKKKEILLLLVNQLKNTTSSSRIFIPFLLIYKKYINILLPNIAFCLVLISTFYNHEWFLRIKPCLFMKASM